jgi:IS1 family transposase
LEEKVEASETNELDEICWYREIKKEKKGRKNIYLITMISRNPRQIMAYKVCEERTEEIIQKMVDNAPKAKKYYTDGFKVYEKIKYPGEYIQNSEDKTDTHNVESINADIRHYIPMLARRSRCFPRKIENLEAIMKLFVNAYNKFGREKIKNRELAMHNSNTKNGR